LATADRIAARSTSSGTPVKSCNTMRATTNGFPPCALPSASSWRVPSHSPPELEARRNTQDGFQHDAEETGNLEIGPMPAFSSAGK